VTGAKVRTAAGKRLVADPQDPLPESNWLWRRVLVFATVLGVSAFVWWASLVVARLGGAEPAAAIAGLVTIVGWLVLLVVVNLVLYLIAPSGEQVAKMAAMVAAMREGVSFGSSSYASADDGYAHAETRAGPVGGDDPPPATGAEGDIDLSGDMKKTD
jgi:hypothetical protein